MQHKITALLFVLSIYAMPANAGVLYDFEDGTNPTEFAFSQGSRWRITTQGLSGQYALCDSLLAGTAIAESFSFAVTPTRALADTFSCLLRFNYLSSTNVQQNTTNTNRFAIFIGANEGASDSTAIIFSSSPLEAFVLTFKGTSGDDTLRLYRKNKNTTLNPASATPIISTKTKVNGKLLAVQLIHLPNGVFRLSVGENGDFTNMQTDTSGVIVSGFAGNYIGIHLVTSLASNRKVIASIDDIKATFVLQPLEVADLQQVNTMQLRVTFNKNIDDSDLLNLQNYELRSVDNVFSVADVQKEDNKSVLLTFATPFVSNNYTLSAQRMRDEFGNEESADKNIDIVISLYGDVVFSELMVKPADNVNFSEEYIELYNRTNHAVNLSGWTLDHSTQTVVRITSGTIPAQDYIMLNYSDTLCNVAKTSSHATLTDRGKQLTLRDPYDVIVAMVTYSDTWYGDASKKDGGFSLEKIDLDNLEETAQNWTACPDERGGTPCGANAAVFVLQPLEISDLQQVNETQLRVTFNKNIDDGDLLNSQNYNLSNVYPTAVQKDDNKSVLLTFTTPFVSNNYTLFVQRMRDEFGNEESADKNIDITVSHYGDVVFSELMVKPADNVNFSEEYIELYNRTNHAVNLSGWTLDHSTKTIVRITSGTIPAQGYIMLNYSDTLCNVAKTSSVAALTDKGKQLTLRDPYDVVVAMVTYSDTWYGDASKKDGGFSLEKIDLDNLEETAQNWTACPDERGGTPCGVNAAVFVLQPLEIANLQQINSMQLRVTFNKNIDDGDLLNSQNYNLSNVYPTAVQKDDNKSVLLTFATPFVSNSYTLFIQRMRDEFGNEESADKNVDITVSHYGDVVFSELMVKPADNVNFSEEYIELYNRTNHAVNLSGWTLDHSTKTIVRITSGTIPAQGYIMLNYGDTLCNVAKTSSVATLTDKGKQLTLRNSYNVMVARVAYSDTWYGDASKNDGGFSLEKIDLDNLEETAQNWTACTDERGGTPCGANAATASNADANLPRCLRYEITDNTLTLTFNEAIATENLTPEKFVCEVSEALAVICSPDEPMGLKIIFANNFFINQSYTLRIENAVGDLQGNRYETFELPIGIGVAPQAGDVVINEILFNPKTGGVDFVELYNISDNLIEMKNNKIANRKVATGDLDKAYRITDSYILQPRQFVVLCTQPDVVCEHYHCEQPDVFITIPTMPSYPNNEGCAAFLDSTGVTIDEFYYTEKMHISLLNSNKGVSLERINPLRPANENANWFSASQVAGFATPTYQNSQYSSTENVNNQQVISILPEVFSPDGDGVDDVLFIDYVMPDFDYLANIYIYDVSGRLVRELHKNVLLGKDGRLMWDGVNHQGTLARIGIYVIVMEAHSQSGKTQVYKKTAVLGTKLGR
ncbi:hypothetical protein FACS189456_2300 [Bacteroidia bacterium]|nr:hypothetical protein FACS189456_2300 [Bacteroidia bacterium]